MPSFLTERFPTEIRATASAFCFHQAAFFGGLIAPGLTCLAVDYEMGFAMPMLIATTIGLLNVCISLLLSPETKGKDFSSDLVVH
jgi:SHS family lactate transporter-like MFS transporter